MFSPSHISLCVISFAPSFFTLSSGDDPRSSAASLLRAAFAHPCARLMLALRTSPRPITTTPTKMKLNKTEQKCLQNHIKQLAELQPINCCNLFALVAIVQKIQ